MRDGDALPIDALRAWMAHADPSLVPAGSTLHVRRFPAGFSNLTYLVRVDDEHGGQRYVLRRPPRGVSGGVAHDMAREHAILAALHPLGVPVPRPLARCDDVDVIGAPFYLMEHVSGPIVRGVLPDELSADCEALPARLRALSQTVVDTMVQVHAVPVANSSLAALGRPEGYVRRQVEGWTKRWHAARTTEVPSLDRLATWLNAHQPSAGDVCLVHNDFKLDNLVLSADLSHVRAILDWEMATIGDPLMDLGTALAYWVGPNDHPIFRSLGLGVTAMPGAFRRDDVVQAYAVASNRDVRRVPFYMAFGFFKVAVIAQQIFARYRQGLTADPRFASLGAVVEALGEQGARVTEEPR
jgi:aminoglycoside phosphotransferase (APT) family kinase protein